MCGLRWVASRVVALRSIPAPAEAFSPRGRRAPSVCRAIMIVQPGMYGRAAPARAFLLALGLCGLSAYGCFYPTPLPPPIGRGGGRARMPRRLTRAATLGGRPAPARRASGARRAFLLAEGLCGLRLRICFMRSALGQRALGALFCNCSFLRPFGRGGW